MHSSYWEAWVFRPRFACPCGNRSGMPHERGRNAERPFERRLPEVTDDGEAVSHVMHEQPFPFVGIHPGILANPDRPRPTRNNGAFLHPPV